jgi:hypothetical protein
LYFFIRRMASTLLIATTWAGLAGCRKDAGGHSGSSPAPEAARAHFATETFAMLDVQKQKETASELMSRFADRTGLTSERMNRRYLWTDAFAVCNFLGLARETGEARYSELALRLVDRVHRTLGKHRPDDSRAGWISGLDPEEAEAHPTRGGLRIGKDLPERPANESVDEQREWDRDGQYLHYLTKWMHALDRVALSTKKPTYNEWARDLAAKAHRAFTHSIQGNPRRRLFWKMSIDLSRPLVHSMGQHDPLDGYVTCAELRATASKLNGGNPQPTLDAEMDDFQSMVDENSLPTDDPLGLGGLLADAYRIDQLIREQVLVSTTLRDRLLDAALLGLAHYSQIGELRRPAEQRLAFRELGLAIGLRAAAWMRRAKTDSLLDRLTRYDSLAREIVSFWLDPAHQQATTWKEHLDINEVMLATALVPDGFLM